MYNLLFHSVVYIFTILSLHKHPILSPSLSKADKLASQFTEKIKTFRRELHSLSSTNFPLIAFSSMPFQGLALHFYTRFLSTYLVKYFRLFPLCWIIHFLFYWIISIIICEMHVKTHYIYYSKKKTTLLSTIDPIFLYNKILQNLPLLVLSIVLLIILSQFPFS